MEEQHAARLGNEPTDAPPLTAPENRKTDDTDGPDDSRANSNTQKPTQPELLLRLCDNLELFHTPDATAFATIATKHQTSGHIHYETRALNSPDFKNYLKRQFHNSYRRPPSDATVDAVVGVLTGKAQFDGLEQQVSVRVAGNDREMFLDLGDEQWRVVRATAEGWKVLDRSPVKFRRPKGMKALPAPERGGSVELLREFINVRDEDQFRLVVGFLLGSLRPSGPYPILEVNGEQGSAKSTLCDFVRSLIDPNEASKKSGPKNERDLAIAVSNSWLSLFDNLSKISDEMSDALCRISTGGAFSARKLYSDSDEQIFNFQRPLIINGIEELAVRPDLLERTLVLDLPKVTAAKRKDLRTLEAEFEAAKPRILGALLDGVVAAMRTLPTVEEREWPRLADFAKWVTAAERAVGWPDGSFLAALSANRQDSALRALGTAEPLSSAIRALAKGAGWVGTATELLCKLRVENENMPLANAPNGLAGRLRRLAPAFREIGVEVDFYTQGGASTRFISIKQRH